MIKIQNWKDCEFIVGLFPTSRCSFVSYFEFSSLQAYFSNVAINMVPTSISTEQSITVYADEHTTMYSYG